MQIYDALEKDHKKLLGLLDRLVDTNLSSAARSKLIAKIRDEMIPHARAEEAILYNSLREIGPAKELGFHGYGEHLRAEVLLRTLQTLDAMDIQWNAAAEKLKEEIEHHISDEETEMFPAAKQLFIDAEAEMMGEAFEKMKPAIRGESLAQTTMDMIANIMPLRVSDSFRKFTKSPDTLV